jgi:hypothetical protein
MHILSNMETTSHTTSPEDAAAALVVAQGATQAAYSPQPLPRWYLPSIGTGVAAVWAAQDTKNHVVMAIASIGYALLLSISIAVVVKKQGRRARIMRAPKTLRFNIVRNSVLVCGALAACFGLTWALSLPHPWLWVAFAGFLVVIVGGRMSERSYENAFARWKAAS